jgi:hypothetical protein
MGHDMMDAAIRIEAWDTTTEVALKPSRAIVQVLDPCVRLARSMPYGILFTI